MAAESLLEVLSLLAPFGAYAVIGGILALRSPQLVKEFFAGVGGLLLAINKVRHDRGRDPSLNRSKDTRARVRELKKRRPHF
jgi:hypothetical protein